MTPCAQCEARIEHAAESHPHNHRPKRAAFIYALSGGGSVLNPSHVDVITLQGAAQPTAPNGYPFKNVPESFSRCDALVGSQGTAQNFWACAALFTVDDNNEYQVLAGYVTWDPTVIVA